MNKPLSWFKYVESDRANEVILILDSDFQRLAEIIETIVITF